MYHGLNRYQLLNNTLQWIAYSRADLSRSPKLIRAYFYNVLEYD